MENNLSTIDDLQEYVKESIQKENEGKILVQQSLENYLKDILDLYVISVENLGDKHSYGDKFKFIAESKVHPDTQYLFEGEYYDFTFYSPKENVLILKQIKSGNLIKNVEEYFYLNDSRKESNKNHYLLKSPLSRIMKNVSNDNEQVFVIDYLKEKLEEKYEFKYEEEREGNISTFSIQVEDVKIQFGFSNTLQISFGKNLQSMQIIYREVQEEKLKKEIDKVLSFLDDYIAWKIKLDNHSITELYGFLDFMDYMEGLNTNALIEQKDYNLLFNSFVIGKNDEYKQIEATIGYKKETKQFIIVINYLFKEIKVECDTVKDVEKTIIQLKEMMI